MGKGYIKGGTPVGIESLCRTCSYRAYHDRLPRVRAGDDVQRASTRTSCVPFTIYECTGYYDKNRPTWQRDAEAGDRRRRPRLSSLSASRSAPASHRRTVKSRVTDELDDDYDDEDDD